MTEANDKITLLCLFHDESAAAAAVHDLLALGLSEQDVAVIGDARTELTGKIPTATLASIRIPDADLPRMMEGLHDGGTIVAVQTTSVLSDRVDEIFANHSAGLVDQKVIPTSTNRFVRPSDDVFDSVEPNRLDMIELEDIV